MTRAEAVSRLAGCYRTQSLSMPKILLLSAASAVTLYALVRANARPDERQA